MKNLNSAICFLVLALLLQGCNSVGKMPANLKTPLEKGFYSYAVYNNENQLVSAPLSQMKNDFMRARLNCKEHPFTDIAIISHGWNFTHQEAISHYHRYMAAMNKNGQGESDRRIYFICIVWSSVSRPLAEGARSILPYGLDEFAAQGFEQVDEFLFHLPSAWKESVDAMEVGVGDPYVGKPRKWDYKYIEDLDENTAHRKLPVSSMITEIDRLRGAEPDFEDVKLHLIGHSYGAKVVTMAAVNALDGRREMIDTLITMNAAFHPDELLALVEGGYWGRKEEEVKEIEYRLKTIPAKVFLHTHYDFATGWVFDFSQIFINNMTSGVTQIRTNDQSEGGTRIDAVKRGLIGAIGLTQEIVTGAPTYVITKVSYLPDDFVCHINSNNPCGVENRFFKYIVNPFHFFVPVDKFFWPGTNGSERGFFRPVYPAIGNLGLYDMARGRGGGIRNGGPLKSFIRKGAANHSKEDVKSFLDGTKSIQFERESIHGIDMSEIFDTGLPNFFVGAHSDLGSFEHSREYRQEAKIMLMTRMIDTILNASDKADKTAGRDIDLDRVRVEIKK